MKTIFNPENATCFIFTFKEGLLAKAAHDLKLKATSFEIEMTGETSLKARFSTRDIQVVHAMKNGIENPSALSDRDKNQIHDNMEREVLKSSRFPEITFESVEIRREQERIQIKGELHLCGERRTIAVAAVESQGSYRAEFRLNQADFGIKPFSALLGAIKIRPEIKVVLQLGRGV